jgi:hypothetical protein
MVRMTDQPAPRIDDHDGVDFDAQVAAALGA